MTRDGMHWNEPVASTKLEKAGNYTASYICKKCPAGGSCDGKELRALAGPTLPLSPTLNPNDRVLGAAAIRRPSVSLLLP
jgi:hypothetical protein